MRNFLLLSGILIMLALIMSGCTHQSVEIKNEALTPNSRSIQQEIEMEAMEKYQVVDYTDITPTEAKELINSTPDIVIIDVSPHYAKGHIPKSINYYLGDGSLDKAIPNLDKEKTYLVYCHVDSVSIAGAQKLIDAGFEKVYRLKGNYKAWVDAGYPVEK